MFTIKLLTIKNVIGICFVFRKSGRVKTWRQTRFPAHNLFGTHGKVFYERFSKGRRRLDLSRCRVRTNFPLCSLYPLELRKSSLLTNQVPFSFSSAAARTSTMPVARTAIGARWSGRTHERLVRAKRKNWAQRLESRLRTSPGVYSVLRTGSAPSVPM